jgi:hypothetical protein
MRTEYVYKVGIYPEIDDVMAGWFAKNCIWLAAQRYVMG